MSDKPISAYEETNGMIYFARMVDKIRKAAAGQLHSDFVKNLGAGFDGRCCDYLKVPYEELKERTLRGGSDEEVLEWCFETGRRLDEGDIFIWNEFLRKVGWRDGISEILVRRKAESGLSGVEAIQTMVEYFEYDEGRKQA